MKTRPFNIPKRLVKQAYQRVKSKGRAAGVDQQSLTNFDLNLKTIFIKSGIVWRQEVTFLQLYEQWQYLRKQEVSEYWENLQ